MSGLITYALNPKSYIGEIFLQRNESVQITAPRSLIASFIRTSIPTCKRTLPRSACYLVCYLPQKSEFRKLVFVNASVDPIPTPSIFSSSERIQQFPNMNALAETWSRSGSKSSDLYKGTSDEITNELKTWILERQALNAAVIGLLWDLFFTNDVIADMQDQNQILENMRVAFKAKQLKNVERVKVNLAPSHMATIQH